LLAAFGIGRGFHSDLDIAPERTNELKQSLKRKSFKSPAQQLGYIGLHNSHQRGGLRLTQLTRTAI